MSDNQTTGKAKAALSDVQGAVGDLASEAKGQVEDRLDEASAAVQSAYDSAKDVVRKRPITGVLVGVGLGLLLAHIFGSQKTVYLREPPRRRSY